MFGMGVLPFCGTKLFSVILRRGAPKNLKILRFAQDDRGPQDDEREVGTVKNPAAGKASPSLFPPGAKEAKRLWWGDNPSAPCGGTSPYTGEASGARPMPPRCGWGKFSCLFAQFSGTMEAEPHICRLRETEEAMEKTVLCKMTKCYAVTTLTYQGELHMLAAPEGPDRCILFDAEGREKSTVWTGPGGVMGMVPLPWKDGAFLATQRFYSFNDAEDARIVLAEPDGEGGWSVKTLCALPFVHRFDVLESGGRRYLLVCTLKGGQAYQGDWQFPGGFWAAELPDDLSAFSYDDPLRLTLIRKNVLRNHGYWRGEEDGREFALVCSEEGVERLDPPEAPGGEWRFTKLLDVPASDAVLMDLDGDGERELAVITPFHGDTFTVYHAAPGGYAPVWTLPEKAEFLHAIWGGEIEGRPAVALGNRAGAMLLFLVRWSGDGYVTEVLDEHCGPANCTGFRHGGHDCILSANRETDEVALYLF